MNTNEKIIILLYLIKNIEKEESVLTVIVYKCKITGKDQQNLRIFRQNWSTKRSISLKFQTVSINTRISLLRIVYLYPCFCVDFFQDACDVGIFYLFAKFELDRSTNNGDLISDGNNWKRRQIPRLKLILSPYWIIVTFGRVMNLSYSYSY